jgi:hypothetical protein
MSFVSELAVLFTAAMALLYAPLTYAVDATCSLSSVSMFIRPYGASAFVSGAGVFWVSVAGATYIAPDIFSAIAVNGNIAIIANVNIGFFISLSPKFLVIK